MQTINTTPLFAWTKQIIKLLYIVKVHISYSLVKWKSNSFANHKQ